MRKEVIDEFRLKDEWPPQPQCESWHVCDPSKQYISIVCCVGCSTQAATGEWISCVHFSLYTTPSRYPIDKYKGLRSVGLVGQRCGPSSRLAKIKICFV
jgi:hypothetical protein